MSQSVPETMLADVETLNHTPIISEITSEMARPQTASEDDANKRVLDTPYLTEVSSKTDLERCSISEKTAADAGIHYVRGRHSFMFVRRPTPVQVEFDEGDPRNPANFSTKRKWTIASCAIFFTCLAGP